MTLGDRLARLDPFLAFLKIGSNWLLLLFDGVVWFLIGWDIAKIHELDLDIFHPAQVVRRSWELFGLSHLGVAAAIFFVPPLFNWFVSFLSRNFETRRTISSKLRHVFLGFHFVTSNFFAIFVSWTTELQVLSGVNGDFTPSYDSISAHFARWLIGSSAAFFVGGTVLAKFASRSSWTEFELWFNLSDSSTDHFPRQRTNLVFANTASIAPPIAWISNREENYRYEYQRRVPTSDDAKQYLLAAAERSRELLREYLFREKPDKADFSIEFLPLTSRGLEVGLTQISNLRKILVSPYEHRSQKKVIEWFKAIHPNVAYQFLEMDYSILQKPWNEQRSWLIKGLKAEMPQDTNGGTVAILISEVHYLTGLVLKVTEVIESLRAEGKSSNLVFMVDGSQSVGNLLQPFNDLYKHLRSEDFYYFSAHKWLLSPNTCGVLVSRQNVDRYEIFPYDLFGRALPTSTIDPGVIFGIKSSLEYLIEEDHLNRFHQKSAALKSFFTRELGDKFEVIQSASQEMNASNFVAVRPRAGYKWKEESLNRFWEQMRNDGVDLTVDDLDGTGPNGWWLRISFPYFLQLHLLKQLIKHLQSRAVSVNY
jgi:hypothetical protein